MEFYKFQHITHLDDFLYWIETEKYNLIDNNITKINLCGTPKLHGTNIGVAFYKNGEYSVQCRNRLVTLDNDHYSICKWLNEDRINYLRNNLKQFIPKDYNVFIVYGEYAGKGIQKGVAISEMERFFAPFVIRVIGDNYDYYIKPRDIDYNLWNDELRVYNLFNTQYSIQVDLLNLDIQKLIEEIKSYVDGCELEDKFAQYFCVDGIGEGIVWDYQVNNNTYFFKTKIDRFKEKTRKVKRDRSIEEIKEDELILTYLFDENRLHQGIDYLYEMNLDVNIYNIGTFIKWVIEDTLREEERFIIGNNINPKRVSKVLSKEIVKWYKDKIYTIRTVRG